MSAGGLRFIDEDNLFVPRPVHFDPTVDNLTMPDAKYARSVRLLRYGAVTWTAKRNKDKMVSSIQEHVFDYNTLK